MDGLLLTEDVFLIAHDDASGKNEASWELDGALAGALLLDVAFTELVDTRDGTVRLTGATPPHPLLARAVEVIAAERKPPTVRGLLGTLPRALKPLAETVGRSLVERGVLAEERAKVMGLFPTTRWPERDPGPERRLRERLHQALVTDVEPEPDAVVLIGLLRQYNLVDGLVARDERKGARRRAAELGTLAESGDAVSKAVADSVRATQAAVMAAIIASNAATIAATTATTS